MKQPDIIISDHALLRYIERHYGFSFKPIMDHIALQVRPAVNAGASTYSVDDITFCLEKSSKGGDVMVVTTVLERNMKTGKWRENNKG
jgi:hypothetical protein